MRARNAFTVMLALAAVLGLSVPARAELVVLSGSLNNLQVVAPVFAADGVTVIGSTSFRADGITPISTSTATGFATVTIDTIAQTITTAFSWTGLSGNADRAHLHDAPPGETLLLSPPNDRFFHEVIIEQRDALGDPILDGMGNAVVSVAGGFVPCGGGLIDPSWDPTNVGCAPASGSLLDRFIWILAGMNRIAVVLDGLDDLLPS